jgi:murein DD-endopeptidase MepM/ murein hydrolase activator NlpD
MRWVLIGFLTVGAIGTVAAWRYRQTAYHLARLAWDRWSLPDVPQDIPSSACPGALWRLPTSGVLGVLWRDTRVPPYGPAHPHTGLDIFGRGREHTVPVYAVADGLLTRLPGWRSAVVVQHEDPLRSGEQVWSYYAHMAGGTGRSYILGDYPAGSAGVPVAAGQLLGYQGVWSGNPLLPGWMHLHFSVIRAAPDGAFLNETVLANTLDPSPYLGIVGNAETGAPNWQPMRCQSDEPAARQDLASAMGVAPCCPATPRPAQ